jgi:hypothetical protein
LRNSTYLAKYRQRKEVVDFIFWTTRRRTEQTSSEYKIQCFLISKVTSTRNLNFFFKFSPQKRIFKITTFNLLVADFPNVFRQCQQIEATDQRPATYHHCAHECRNADKIIIRKSEGRPKNTQGSNIKTS